MKKAVAMVRAQKAPNFRGDRQSLCDIAAFYNVPRETLRKRSLRVIKGTAHRSGGDRTPKVLSKGK